MLYRIATRASKLALIQATLVQNEMRRLYPAHEWELERITTTGDRFQDKPLIEFGGKGAFLKEIEEALLDGRAHLAVHSLKDVPSVETAGLQLSAFLPREDPRDVWICEAHDPFHLPAGSRIGTSSLRRQVLMRVYRPDLKVEMLRGNVDTRLRKFREHQFDALILAAAGLHRMQLFDDTIMEYMMDDAFIPAIGQGVMVVQTASDNREVAEMTRALNHPETEIAALVERTFLSRYDGGCMLPIGGLAKRRGQTWHFRAFIGGIRSGRIAQDVVEDSDPFACAGRMVLQLNEQGAQELLAELKSQ